MLVTDPAQLETLTFNLLVENAASTDPNLAQIQLTGSLGPLTTATGASATTAIPRFADPTAPPVLNLRVTSALVTTTALAPARPRTASVGRRDAGAVSGGNVTFAQTVLNDTDSAAINVRVRNNLPPGLILIGCSSSDGTGCAIDGNNAEVSFAPPGTGGLEFYPLAPCRVADTRSFTGSPSALGPPSIAAHNTRSFPVLSSACGIPASAVAYSLNVSAVPLNGYLGYLTTWGTGQPQPNASTLNSWTGTIAANAAIVPAGTLGAISIYASDATDVFFDINGYFAPPGAGGLQYRPVAPCRIADTRSFTGPASPLGPPSLTAQNARSFPVLSSICGVPSTAAVYALNVTAQPATGYLGYLTTWATGQPQPNASTLNSWTGTIVPNMALVPAGTGGAISIYASDVTDVFFDINGYFAP